MAGNANKPVIHYSAIRYLDDYALCGATNVRTTETETRVTCPKCLKEISKEDKRFARMMMERGR